MFSLYFTRPTVCSMSRNMSMSVLLGARWDIESGIISEAFLGDLTPAMPVLYVRAVPAEEQELRNTFECPVYRTKQRGSTYVWAFHLRTKEPHPTGGSWSCFALVCVRKSLGQGGAF
uniref:DYH17 n=1 Tax=Poeciliopsis prolifica TaxID=188132 RepID=A0A0S7ESV1_9TELE